MRRDFERLLHGEFMRMILARLPVLSRGFSLLLNALMAVVIARFFGAAASGEFFLAFAAVNFIGMVGRLGTETQALKTLPGFFHSNRLDLLWRELDWLRKYCWKGSALAGVILATSGLALWLTGGSPVVGIHLLLLSISIPFSSSSILESAALRSVNRYSRGAFAETGLSQGLTIGFLFLISIPFHPSALVVSASYSIAAVCTAIVSRVWMKNAVPRPRAETVDVLFLPPRGYRASMFFMMGSSVLLFALTATPLFILGVFASVRDVGLYNAATRVSVFVSLIPALQTIYLVPRVSKCVAILDIAGANILLRKAARQASGATFLLAAGIMLFAGKILAIFGSDFVGALPALLVLLIGQILISSLGNINPIMSVVGLERASALTVAIALGVGILPMGYAAVYWGSAGVAVVFSLVSLGYAIASNVLVQARLGIRCFVS